MDIAQLGSLVHQMIFELGSKGVIPKRFVEATRFEVSQYRELPGCMDAMRGRAFFYSPEFCELWGIEAGKGHRLGDRVAPRDSSS